MQLSGKGGKKTYIFGLGHMTKMAAKLIYGSMFYSPVLQNHGVDCLET